MKQHSLYSFPLFALLLTVLVACQKEELLPEVQILEPRSGQSYRFGDTLKIRAQAKNANTDLQVTLQQNNQPVGLPGITIYGDESEIFRELYYKDRYLEGGTYEVKVTARNSETFISDFRQVQLQALPLRQMGLAYLSNARLTLLDSAGNTHQTSLAEDFAQIAFAGRPQLIGLRAKDGSKVQFYEPKKASLTGEIFAESGNEIIDLQVQEGIFYVLYRNGKLTARRDAQNREFTYRLPINRLAESMAIGEDGLVITGRAAGDSQRKLFYFIKNQSVAVQQLPLTRRKSLVQYWQNEHYLLSHAKGETTELWLHDAKNISAAPWQSLPDYSVKAMLRDGLQGMYLVTDVKLLQIMSTSEIRPREVLNFAPEALKVARTDNSLYFTNGSLLQRRVNGRDEFVISSNQNINDFTLIYNK